MSTISYRGPANSCCSGERGTAASDEPPARASLDEVVEPVSECAHLFGRPDRLGVVGEPRDLLGAHTRARGQHEIVVRKLLPTDSDRPLLLVE